MSDVVANLAVSLNLGRREMVAFVGCSDSVALMLELARQLDEVGRVVRAGTTTSVAADDVQGLRQVVHARASEGRLLGAPPDHFDGLLRLGWIEVVALVADRVRTRRPVVAPAPHGPLIPRATTHVVTVMHVGALDAVIEDHAERPLRLAAIAGCRPFERLTPERAAVVACSAQGGRKHAPPMARFSVAVTGVGDEHADAVTRLREAVRVLDPLVRVVRVPELPAPSTIVVSARQ